MSEFTLDAFLDMPDDDDMPPLVDRPLPTMAMMSYSFDADFTPIPYSPDEPGADMATEPTPRFELISEEDAPRISATKPSHAKKRDAGHIPRPPNAFILFRSSFIKSESVPGNIEGNHSTLSKIIGIVWKTLPPAEREQWEKRAMQAQAEHRARYPDWRFRPGTNVDAIAKRKTKDKNKDRPPARRRRNPSTRDKGPIVAAATSGGGAACGDAGGGGRCKGTRGLIQERRCAQIAELVARGFKGVALTSAVQAWDKESGASNVTDGVFVSEQGGGVSIGGGTVGASVNSRGRKEMRDAKDAGSPAAAIKTTKTRSASTAQQARFFNDVPFTSMFRRAASVPLAPDHGGPAAMAQGVAAITPSPTITTTTSISPVPDLYPPPLSPASSVSYGSELSFPDSDNMSVPPMFDFVPFSPPGSPCSPSLDNNDLGALGAMSPTLGMGPAGTAAAAAAAAGQGHHQHQGLEPPSLQNFFSSYSTLCDWAGGAATAACQGMVTDGGDHHHHHLHLHNGGGGGGAKVVLPSLSLQYGCLGEAVVVDDHAFAFLPTAPASAAMVDPWNNVQQDLVARPLFGGFEDTWLGARVVPAAAAPYA